MTPMVESMRFLSRRVQRVAAPRSVHATSTAVTQLSSGVVPRAFATHCSNLQHSSSSSSWPSATIAVAASAAVVGFAMANNGNNGAALCESTDNKSAAQSDAVDGSYKGKPIQHVAALLLLYEDIDKNMEVLGNRMLDDLQKRVTKEKAENNGKLQVSPEQIALHMSIEFESTLEKVQDAVFRNNYVTKEQVQDALQRMMKGELRGGGANGKLTIQEAEAIENYVKRLERLRWKVTGSRDPLIPTHNKSLLQQETPKIPLATVVEVMESLIPTLTTEMEGIVAGVRLSESSGLSASQQHQLIANEYIKRSGELTEKFCSEKKIDLREFQAALVFYHDDPVFEKALARLAADQQRR